MKIPVIDDRYNLETGRVEPTRVDIMTELQQETVCVLAMVTQCDANVVLSGPVKVRTVAGFDHYSASGEFSSGDAYGDILFTWTVRQDSPQFYDVNRIVVRMGDIGQCEVDWRSHNAFLDRMTQEYRMFLEATKFVPRRYAEIEDILDQIRALEIPGKYRGRVVELADKVSALLGNSTKEHNDGNRK